jgi:hypothetical protein
VGQVNDREDTEDQGLVTSSMNEIRGLRAEALQDLDLFE